MKRIIYEIGYKFPGTRLTVIENLPPKNQHSQVRCICDCGNEWVGPISKPVTDTKSCGCLKKEKASQMHKKHGLRNHPLFRVWYGMKRRCYDKNEKEYHNYGGRGISVCDEWRNDFLTFYNWATENGYSADLTIDRIDVDGNYEASNCRWATQKEQQRNRRNNRRITISGETKLMAEWAEESGITGGLIAARISRHWDEGYLLIPPIGRVKYKTIKQARLAMNH